MGGKEDIIITMTWEEWDKMRSYYGMNNKKVFKIENNNNITNNKKEEKNNG